jgi:formamidopyrimidine-DNA glycosylase
VPELPEVETTRRGLAPLVVGRDIEALIVHEPRLRWPVAADLPGRLARRRIEALDRRGKYLLFGMSEGTVLVHLGMSGSLRFLSSPTPLLAHDHLELVLAGGGRVRYNDPRRFGSVVFTADPSSHPLLVHLGPEPLGAEFTASYLHARSRGRRTSIKQFLMDAGVVVGVGNIYANEALFRAGIHPAREAGSVSRVRLERLVGSVRAVLAEALAQGGTTLRNYVDSHGRPGWFKQSLAVYERAELPCPTCQTPVRRVVLGQRATYYCGRCQR